jgi:hypothetical protein
MPIEIGVVQSVVYAAHSTLPSLTTTLEAALYRERLVTADLRLYFSRIQPASGQAT